MGLSPQCGKGLFSQSQLPVQTLLQCPFSPRVQSCASTARCMLKLQNTGSYTIIWTNENTAQPVGVGATVLAAAQSLLFFRMLLPIKRPCSFYIWVLETSVQDTQGLKDRSMLFFFFLRFFYLGGCKKSRNTRTSLTGSCFLVSWWIQKIQDTQDLNDTIMLLLCLGECRKSWTPGFERQDCAFVYVWVVAENPGVPGLER